MEKLILSYPDKNIKVMKYMPYVFLVYMLVITMMLFYFLVAFELIFISLIFALPAILSWIQYIIMSNTRIIVDKYGIYHKVNAPKWICFLPYSKDWSVKWEDLNDKTIRLNQTVLSKIIMPSPLTIGFKFNTNSETTLIYPCQWVKSDTKDKNYFEKMPFNKDKKTAEKFKNELIQHCSLLNYLHQLDFNIVIDLPKDSLKPHFQYSLNRYSGILFGLIITFIIGFLFSMLIINGEHYIPEPPLHFFIGSGFIISALLLFWLKSADIPVEDSGIYVFLAGVCFAFLSFATPLAVNKMTDTQGVQLYQYRLQEIKGRDVIFYPANNSELPVVSLGNPEYWQQFKIRSEHDIGLRRGALKFYQLNTDNLRNKLDDFYQNYFKNNSHKINNNEK